jgi:hypothetical protein
MYQARLTDDPADLLNRPQSTLKPAAQLAARYQACLTQSPTFTPAGVPAPAVHSPRGGNETKGRAAWIRLGNALDRIGEPDLANHFRTAASGGTGHGPLTLYIPDYMRDTYDRAHAALERTDDTYGPYETPQRPEPEPPKHCPTYLGDCQHCGGPVDESHDHAAVIDATGRYYSHSSCINAAAPAPPTTPALDMDLARRAYAHISHTPDRRAEQCRAEVAAHLADIEARYTALAQTDEQRATLAAELDRYRAGFLAHYHAWLTALGRTASWAITGRSNFPTRRNEKAMQTERRRADDLAAWQTRAESALKRAVLAARTPDQVDDQAWQRVKRWIDTDMATVAKCDAGELPYDRTAWVTSVVSKIRRMLTNGETVAAVRACAYIREQQATWRKPFITERNGLWAEVAAAAAASPVEGKTGCETIAERDDVTAVRNYDADRLQILFTDKPDAETRQRLKSTGWRWSPNAGAWQRQITNAAEHSLRAFLAATTV